MISCDEHLTGFNFITVAQTWGCCLFMRMLEALQNIITINASLCCLVNVFSNLSYRFYDLEKPDHEQSQTKSQY